MGIAVALYAVSMKLIYPFNLNLDELLTLTKRVLTDGSTLLLAGDANLLPYSALGLILVILLARIATRKGSKWIELSRARRSLMQPHGSDRVFASKRRPMTKPCPNCAEQLPLAAIICGACDHNFLADRPGRVKLLPPPEPMIQDSAEPRAAAGI
jgi:hypothetical protein